jgi:hypothetical protein
MIVAGLIEKKHMIAVDAGTAFKMRFSSVS